MAGRKFHISTDDFLEVQKMNEEEGNVLPSSENKTIDISPKNTEMSKLIEKECTRSLVNEEKKQTNVHSFTGELGEWSDTENVRSFASERTEGNDTEIVTAFTSEQTGEKANYVYTTTNYDIFDSYPDDKLRLPLLVGTEREKLSRSIRINGILSPLICKINPDNPMRLIILSGHNRLDIAKEEKCAVPYIIKNDLSLYEEQLIVIDENVVGRQIENILPSHLAYLLKTKREAEAHQGIAGGSWVENGASERYGMKKTMILAYIKLNELIPEFLYMVDDKKLTIKAGYNLAFISADNQKLLYEYLQLHHNLINISESIAKRLKEKNSMNCKFTPEFLDMFFEIISSPKTEPSSAPRKAYGSIVREYFGWASDEDAESIIREALTMANRNTIEILHKKGE